jgi:hypothetical protein
VTERETLIREFMNRTAELLTLLEEEYPPGGHLSVAGQDAPAKPERPLAEVIQLRRRA